VTNSGTTQGFSAAEFQPATSDTQLAGSVVITTDFGSTAPFASAGVTDRARLTVSLTNGAWTSASGGVSAPATTGTNPAQLANCNFGTTPVNGGGVGNSTLEFLSTAAAQISACTGAAPTFTFSNIRRVSNNAPVIVNFAYAQVDQNGAAVVGTSISKSVTLAETASAWGSTASEHKFTADATVATTSSATGILSDANTTLGTVRTSFRTTAPSVTNTTTPEAKPIRVGATGGATIAPADLFASGTITIDFPQGAANIASVKVAGIVTETCTGPVTVTAPAVRYTCALVPADLGTALATARAITIARTGTAIATPVQTPTATLAVTTQTGYVASGFGPTPLRAISNNDGRVNGVNIIGASPSRGKWTAFGSGGTESQFRISGLTAAQAANVEGIRLTVAAGGNGVAVAPTDPGFYTLTNTGDPATGFVVRGGTLVFNSKGLGVAAGMGTTTGNADINSISLRYIGTTVPAVTIDRQLANRNPTSIVAVPAN